MIQYFIMLSLLLDNVKPVVLVYEFDNQEDSDEIQPRRHRDQMAEDMGG
jgi:hypothetical protein